MVRKLTIGIAAEQSGCNVETIRYYERTGLIAPPHRSAGNQRQYGSEDIDRLKFIRRSRDLGFSIETIRDLLALSDQPDRPCAEVDDIARAQLGEVRQRIERLRALESELTRILRQCSGGTVADCRVIDALSA